MNSKLAEAIIVEAKSLGVYDGYLPESDGDRISEAERIIQNAKIAWDQKVRGHKTKAILAMVPGEDAFAEETITLKRKETIEPTLPKEAESSTEAESVPRKMDKVYEQRQYAIAQIRKEGLPVPPDFQGEPPILPRDITVLSDRGLRELQSTLMAAHARVNWLIAIESADQDAADKIAQHYFNKRLKLLDKLDSETKKAKVIPVLESEASEDPMVVKWRSKLIDHRNAARMMKALRDGYVKSLDVVSREYTMRETERDHG